MRVLFFNFEFPPLGGGGANANAYLFRELSENPSVAIDCVTSAVGSADEVVHFSENITVYRLAVAKKQLHFWTQREVLTYLWRAYRRAKALLGEKRYDLSHGFFGFPSGLLCWLFRERLPYLISLRGSDVPGFNPRFSLQYVALNPLFRLIWRDARFMVANSHGLRTLAQAFAPELKIGVVPNGIDTGEFAPRLAQVQGAGEILCVSRLVSRKGVQHLVEAMPRVLAQVPDARLRIVGEGDLKASLERRCSDLGLAGRVVFHGYVPHGQLATLYRRARLFVQPSFYEGMSNTVLEAMASGLPIVTSAQGGREELFDGNAALVPYGDVQSLAETVADVLLDRQGQKSMSRRSREIAMGFSWSAVAEQYLDMYRKMIEAPKIEGRPG